MYTCSGGIFLFFRFLFPKHMCAHIKTCVRTLCSCTVYTAGGDDDEKEEEEEDEEEKDEGEDEDDEGGSQKGWGRERCTPRAAAVRPKEEPANKKEKEK